MFNVLIPVMFSRSRLWSVLEYISGLKYLSGRCLDHVFMNELVRVLETADKNLQTLLKAHSSFDQQLSGQMVSGRTEADTDLVSRAYMVRTLLARIAEARKSTHAPPSGLDRPFV